MVIYIIDFFALNLLFITKLYKLIYNRFIANICLNSNEIIKYREDYFYEDGINNKLREYILSFDWEIFEIREHPEYVDEIFNILKLNDELRLFIDMIKYKKLSDVIINVDSQLRRDIKFDKTFSGEVLFEKGASLMEIIKFDYYFNERYISYFSLIDYLAFLYKKKYMLSSDERCSKFTNLDELYLRDCYTLDSRYIFYSGYEGLWEIIKDKVGNFGIKCNCFVIKEEQPNLYPSTKNLNCIDMFNNATKKINAIECKKLEFITSNGLKRAFFKSFERIDDRDGFKRYERKNRDNLK